MTWFVFSKNVSETDDQNWFFSCIWKLKWPTTPAHWIPLLVLCVNSLIVKQTPELFLLLSVFNRCLCSELSRIGWDIGHFTFLLFIWFLFYFPKDLWEYFPLTKGKKKAMKNKITFCSKVSMGLKESHWPKFSSTIALEVSTPLVLQLEFLTQNKPEDQILCWFTHGFQWLHQKSPEIDRIQFYCIHPNPVWENKFFTLSSAQAFLWSCAVISDRHLRFNCIKGMKLNKLLAYSEYLWIIICIFSATKVLRDWK